ncbi:MAG: peptidylprolyl isomerase [Anaerolineae bacterium]|nr:peptidylprolyl isomerase [Anaerolineae bacterium]
MVQAENGNTVKVHYTGKLEDGTVFDTSVDRDPLQFTIGRGQIIPGFEEAVIGMSLGESKTETIPPDKAYGPHHAELMLTLNRNQIPTHLTPEIGQRLEIHQPDGQTIGVTVSEISEKNITLDANHPLAGQELTFDIELLEVT